MRMGTAGPPAQLPADVEARPVGQADVEHQEVRVLRPGPGTPRRGGLVMDLVPLPADPLEQSEAATAGVVLNHDEDAARPVFTTPTVSIRAESSASTERAAPTDLPRPSSPEVRAGGRGLAVEREGHPLRPRWSPQPPLASCLGPDPGRSQPEVASVVPARLRKVVTTRSCFGRRLRSCNRPDVVTLQSLGPGDLT